VNYAIPVICGLMYRDSVEIDELKHPIHVDSMRILPTTGGAGRFRGAPQQEIVYGPTRNPMTVVIRATASSRRRAAWSAGMMGAPARPS